VSCQNRRIQPWQYDGGDYGDLQDAVEVRDAELQRLYRQCDADAKRWAEMEVVVSTAREALRGSEHEGPCTPLDEWGPCRLCVAASGRRVGALAAALATLEEV
jgi:hypothetical protein